MDFGRMSNGQSHSIPMSVRFGGAIVLFYVLLSIAALLLLMLGERHEAKASQPIVIKMIDMPPAFEPAQVTISAGESVEWMNVGNEVHHATSDPSLAIKKTEVTNPAGAAPFDSGFLRPGETFTHSFPKPGVYKYACVVHEVKGMVGEIVVK